MFSFRSTTTLAISFDGNPYSIDLADFNLGTASGGNCVGGIIGQDMQDSNGDSAALSLPINPFRPPLTPSSPRRRPRHRWRRTCPPSIPPSYSSVSTNPLSFNHRSGVPQVVVHRLQLRRLFLWRARRGIRRPRLDWVWCPLPPPPLPSTCLHSPHPELLASANIVYS